MSSWQPAIENEAVFDKAARKRMKRSKRIIESRVDRMMAVDRMNGRLKMKRKNLELILKILL